MKNFTKKQLQDFQSLIWNFYKNNQRDFAWRHIDDPYEVFVSEIMLQQTQTARVIEKYELFLSEFPTVYMLAQATLADVLSVWQGLGYNRRAKFAHECAKKIVTEYNGFFPNTQKELELLPGIGPYTASAITTFAYNKKAVFIETNIRTVFLHSFFKNKENISDKELLILIEKTLPENNFRDWYYALMDYGVYLKAKYPGINKKSKHYTKQSKFNGSDRQIRGAIIRQLTKTGSCKKEELFMCIDRPKEKIEAIINDLLQEKLISVKDGLCILGYI